MSITATLNYNLFIEPYVKGCQYLQASFATESRVSQAEKPKASLQSISLTLAGRIKKFALGLGLLVPIINIAILVLLKTIEYQNSSKKVTSSALALIPGERVIDHYSDRKPRKAPYIVVTIKKEKYIFPITDAPPFILDRL